MFVSICKVQPLVQTKCCIAQVFCFHGFKYFRFNARSHVQSQNFVTKWEVSNLSSFYFFVSGNFRSGHRRSNFFNHNSVRSFFILFCSIFWLNCTHHTANVNREFQANFYEVAVSLTIQIWRSHNFSFYCFLHHLVVLFSIRNEH